jgi:hypothetical protein
MVCAVAAVMGIWACEATRNRDGSFTIQFAPDMTITAYGLEDALGKMTDLLADCLLGTFPRTCTIEEIQEITDTIDELLEKKEKLKPPAPGPASPRPC